ncbi:hypothetical protein BG57_10335 [Caballeronia grimmiae]|uniref:Uncharacterized protein n=1 Tax=Caballeronia grimmiae TaxID=1071679 RepID=A0A069P8N8_9BURK|nr:hypothetical protein BG57_10335 [Caballeronia grimmiae]
MLFLLSLRWIRAAPSTGGRGTDRVYHHALLSSRSARVGPRQPIGSPFLSTRAFASAPGGIIRVLMPMTGRSGSTARQCVTHPHDAQR